MNRRPDQLVCAHLPFSRLVRQPPAWRERLLGFACYCHAGQTETAPPDAIPSVTVSMPPLLAAAENVCEGWLTGSQAGSGHFGAIRFRQADGLLFGCLSVAESDFTSMAQEAGIGRTPLRQATASAYREMFALLDRLEVPHLYRVWNYLPDINGESHGIERYRQFNIGRQDAFLACARPLTGNVPAACALGSMDGPLNLSFLAGREAPLPIENPRQVSAYHYPERYGPRAPTFSRAMLAPIGGQWVLFISGTASIAGHQSLHPEDPVAQTRETMANIQAIVDEANSRVEGTKFDLARLHYKVYVRRPSDAAAIRAELQRCLGFTASATFLQADICRRELLVEIEASGGHAIESL